MAEGKGDGALPALDEDNETYGIYTLDERRGYEQSDPGNARGERDAATRREGRARGARGAREGRARGARGAKPTERAEGGSGRRADDKRHKRRAQAPQRAASGLAIGDELPHIRHATGLGRGHATLFNAGRGSTLGWGRWRTHTGRH
eukprot:gene22809-22272_t